MRLHSTIIPQYFSQLIAALRQRLRDQKFIARHRAEAADFTRRRALPFERITLFIFQKTTRSIQRHLHAFWDEWQLDIATVVTPGAVTPARAKLKHTVFIALNRATVLPMIYDPANAGARQRWRGCPTAKRRKKNLAWSKLKIISATPAPVIPKPTSA